MAEILGAKLPKMPGEDSFSMVPLLKGEDRPIRNNAVNTACGGTPSFREGPWKYIAAPSLNSTTSTKTSERQ
jgi:arylsulfatase A